MLIILLLKFFFLKWGSGNKKKIFSNCPFLFFVESEKKEKEKEKEEKPEITRKGFHTVGPLNRNILVVGSQFFANNVDSVFHIAV